MTLYYPPTQNALQKTLTVALDEGETTSATLSNVTGVQNKAGVCVIDRVDANGTVKSSSDWEWVSFTGTSGSTITGLTRGLGGSSDQDHASGAVVEFVADVVWAGGVMGALDNAFTSAGAVDTTKIVTPAGTQTLTNKTLTAPTVTSPTINTAVSGTAVKDEDNMASNSATAVATQQSIKAYIDTQIAAITRLQSKIIYATRDLAASSGDVSYTGAGFKPTVIIAFGSMDNFFISSFGFSDSSLGKRAVWTQPASSTFLGRENLVFFSTAVGSDQIAVVKSYDDDGFTLTWAKTGTPSGTSAIAFLCFR